MTRVQRRVEQAVVAASTLAFATTFALGGYYLPMVVSLAGAAAIGAPLLPDDRLFGSLVILLSVVAAGAAVPSVLSEQDVVYLGSAVVPLSVAVSLAVIVAFVAGTRRSGLFAASE